MKRMETLRRKVKLSKTRDAHSLASRGCPWLRLGINLFRGSRNSACAAIVIIMDTARVLSHASNVLRALASIEQAAVCISSP